ncbi:MAG: DNA internalization-related competence protein ComEC/Rec2 [Lachnospiraceae bacterium]|nr:DNA internalization-related competence protein ComEC/Rec2 [Lachnospiraceae bacterium]
MTKRPLCYVAYASVIGIWYGISESVLSIIIGGIIWLCGMIPLVYQIYHEKRSGWLLFRAIILIPIFGIAVLHARSANQTFIEYQSKVRDYQNILQTGTVKSVESKNNRWEAVLKTEGGLVLLLQYEDDSPVINQLKIGEKITVSGRVKHFQIARNFGNFDAKSYYQSMGIAFGIDHIELIENDHCPNQYLQLLQSIRNRVHQIYEKYLDGESAGLLEAMILGEKTQVDESVKSSYQKAGIAHVLAVSGLHISLVCMIMFRILRKQRKSFMFSEMIAILLGIQYLFLSGASVSTYRALIMLLFSLTAKTAGKYNDLHTTMAITGAMMLWNQPFLLYNAGFIMSFSAIAGIAFWKHKHFAGIGITLMTSPVLLYFYYYFSPYSMILNLIVIPLMTPIVLLAIVGGFGGLIPFVGGFFSVIMLNPCSLLLKVIRFLCDLSLKLPNSNIILGRPALSKIIIYYSILLLGYWIVTRYKRRAEWLRVLILCSILLFKLPRDTMVTVLDVGQGDATLVHLKSGENCFFDGGSTDIKEVGTYRILPHLKAMGIEQIDYWFVSHLDEDHYSGLIEILQEGYPVEYLIISDASAKEEQAEQLIALSKANHTKVLEISKGWQIKFGQEAKIECLWPESGSNFSDRNDGSLALRFTQDGFTGLICGDLTEIGEQAILTTVGDVNWYKCNHHGSNTSSTTSFLDAICPEVTTISCGIDNSYGHPGEKCVERLILHESKIFCTMDLGQVNLKPKDDSVEISSFLQ